MGKKILLLSQSTTVFRDVINENAPCPGTERVNPIVYGNPLSHTSEVESAHDCSAGILAPLPHHPQPQ